MSPNVHSLKNYGTKLICMVSTRIQVFNEMKHYESLQGTRMTEVDNPTSGEGYPILLVSEKRYNRLKEHLAIYSNIVPCCVLVIDNKCVAIVAYDKVLISCGDDYIEREGVFDVNEAKRHLLFGFDEKEEEEEEGTFGEGIFGDDIADIFTDDSKRILRGVASVFQPIWNNMIDSFEFKETISRQFYESRSEQTKPTTFDLKVSPEEIHNLIHGSNSRFSERVTKQRIKSRNVHSCYTGTFGNFEAYHYYVCYCFVRL